MKLSIILTLLFLIPATQAAEDNAIIYGVGAAGVTFKTHFYEAQHVLTPKPDQPDPWTVTYEEGVTIRWDEATLLPHYIQILPNYVGPVRTSNAGISVTLNQNFSGRYANNIKGAEQLARHLYQTFEESDPTYDCLAASTCSIDWSYRKSKVFTVRLPAMRLMFQNNPIVLDSITLLDPKKTL